MSLSPIPGAATAAAAYTAQVTPKPSPQPAASTAAPSRATEPDTVTISSAGQQAAKTSGNMDHDGDSK